MQRRVKNLTPPDRIRTTTSLQSGISEAELLVRAKKFGSAGEVCARLLSHWSLTPKQAAELKPDELIERIREPERPHASKVLNILGTAEGERAKSTSDTQKKREFHNNAVALILRATELDPDNVMALLGLGRECTPVGELRLPHGQYERETQLALRAYGDVLDIYGITNEHLAGQKPMEEVQGMPRDWDCILWALSCLGRLQTKRAREAKFHPELGPVTIFAREGIRLGGAILEAYGMPRDVLEISEISSKSLNRLPPSRSETLMWALLNLGDAHLQAGDLARAYNALELCHSMAPDLHMVHKIRGECLARDPGLEGKKVKGHAITPNPLWERKTSEKKPGVPGPKLPDAKPIKPEEPEEKPPEEKKPKTWRELSKEASTKNPVEILKGFGLNQTFMVQEWKNVKLPPELQTKYRDECKVLLRETHALTTGGHAVAEGFLAEYKARARRWHETPISQGNLCQFLCEKALVEAVAEGKYMMAGRESEAEGIALSYIEKADKIPAELKPQQEAIEASYKRIFDRATKK